MLYRVQLRSVTRGGSSVGRCASGRSGLSMFCLAERSLQGRWIYSHNFLNISPPRELCSCGISILAVYKLRRVQLSSTSRRKPEFSHFTFFLMSVAAGFVSNDRASQRTVPELVSDRSVLGFLFSTPLCSTLLFISASPFCACHLCCY